MDKEGKREVSSLMERIFRVATVCLSLIVLILSALGLIGILKLSLTNSIVIPILGVVNLLNGIITFKKNKAAGIFLFCGAAFVFLICIFVFTLKLLH